jgi:micrococcal nuclease
MTNTISENDIITNRARTFLGLGSVISAGIIVALVILVPGYLKPPLTTDNLPVVPISATTAVNVTTGIPSTPALLPLGTSYQVTDVVDGDTIKVNVSGKVVVIRLIGINTPELKGANGLADCYAVTAKLAMEQAIGNHNVYLEKDPSQGELDKYGRTLAYIWLDPGSGSNDAPSDLNLMQIQEGNAVEYTYNKPYKYQKIYKEAEAQAKKAGAGLWSACQAG